MSEDETYVSHNGKIMFALEYSEAPTGMHLKMPQLLWQKRKKIARPPSTGWINKQYK